MGVQWTKEQQEVIRLRDRNILVSAAAGSGKTAVLVQRILSKIMDPLKPVDIDRLLIMTFTRAAAGKRGSRQLLKKHSVRIPIMSICRDRQPCFILHRLQLLMVSVPILSGITFI